MTALLTRPEQAPLGRLDLDDLDVDLAPGLPPAATDAQASWPRPAYYRRPAPDPVFAGDWLARMYDAGTPLHLLQRWRDRHAWYRRPDLPQAMTHRPLNPGPPPASVLLAEQRLDDETVREHLLRLGRQVRLFDMPAARIHQAADPGWARSVFADSAAVPIDAQVVLASSPLTVDRLYLAARGNVSVRVLEALAEDCTGTAATTLALHRKITPAIARTLWDRAQRDANRHLTRMLMRNTHLSLGVRAGLLATLDPDAASSILARHMVRSRHPVLVEAWHARAAQVRLPKVAAPSPRNAAAWAPVRSQ